MINKITDGPEDEYFQQRRMDNDTEIIKELKAEKLALQSHITNQDEKIGKLAKDNARLKAVLLRFGNHKATCRLKDGSKISPADGCNCGFSAATNEDEALAATDSPEPTQTKEQAKDSITAITCVHHTDKERSEITCPCCLQNDAKRAQDVIQILSEALQEYVPTALFRDALARADAAGKGEK